MSKLERVFHAVLFEIIAVIVATVATMYITGRGAADMSMLAIAISVIAMLWNFFYNWGFDAIYGATRHLRSWTKRFWHGVGFEAGMVILSFPVIMLWLDMGFWEVLLMDIGFVIFFFLYAITYNYIYDMVRLSIVGAPKAEAGGLNN